MAPIDDNIPYPRSCLADPTCSDLHKGAALIDWVRNIYVADSLRPECIDHSPRYDDGYLSPQEASCVDVEMGLPRGVTAAHIDDYLLQAHANLAGRKNSPQYRQQDCEQYLSHGMCGLGHYRSTQGYGVGIMIGCHHDCLPQHAELLLASGVEVHLAGYDARTAHAQWVFFIEGHRFYAGPDGRDYRTAATDETYLFERIADVLHIPTYEATPVAINDATAQAIAVRETGTPRAVFEDAVVLSQYDYLRHSAKDLPQLKERLARELLPLDLQNTLRRFQDMVQQAERDVAVVPPADMAIAYRLYREGRALGATSIEASAAIALQLLLPPDLAQRVGKLTTDMHAMDQGTLNMTALEKTVIQLGNITNRFMPDHVRATLNHEHDPNKSLRALFIIGTNHKYGLLPVYNQQGEIPIRQL